MLCALFCSSLELATRIADERFHNEGREQNACFSVCLSVCLSVFLSVWSVFKPLLIITFRFQRVFKPRKALAHSSRASAALRLAQDSPKARARRVRGSRKARARLTQGFRTRLAQGSSGLSGFSGAPPWGARPATLGG